MSTSRRTKAAIGVTLLAGAVGITLLAAGDGDDGERGKEAGKRRGAEPQRAERSPAGPERAKRRADTAKRRRGSHRRERGEKETRRGAAARRHDRLDTGALGGIKREFRTVNDSVGRSEASGMKADMDDFARLAERFAANTRKRR